MTDSNPRLVTLDREANGIAVVSMRDAVGKNAFSEAFVADIEGCLAQAAADQEVKVIVLVGLPDVFASGAPRELLVKLARGEEVPSDILLSKAVLDQPVPVIAAMEGHATGGGLALGLCADIVLLARESRYGASFMNMGFTPGMGITRLLEHVLSPALAHELLYTGEFRRGTEFALRTGVNYVLPRAEIRPKAFDVAASIAEKPRVALETLKRWLSLDRRRAFEDTRTLETMMHEITFRQEAVRQRIEDEYVD
ncbi:MAG: enoyl-CoA hydratase/isomerase family protein [Polyangiaceae bacterium]|nr:enoyl-CoA hydratase/isomerase family protein [Polyangiaceae bacterium]